MVESYYTHRRVGTGSVVVGYYNGNFTVAYHADGGVDSWGQWASALRDGDTRRNWGPGLRRNVSPDQLLYPTTTFSVTDPSGSSTEYDITELLVEAYQEVEGEDVRPMPPDYSEMSDEELVDYVDGRDDELSLNDIAVIYDEYNRGLISDDQADALLRAFTTQ